MELLLGELAGAFTLLQQGPQLLLQAPQRALLLLQGALQLLLLRGQPLPLGLHQGPLLHPLLQPHLQLIALGLEDTIQREALVIIMNQLV
jgi:hypothetical protein